MRTHLSKSLQTRCKTIRRAVTAYNAAAAALVPPRPAVDWEKVSHYSFLEEFNLLQDTRNDVRAKRWSEPAVRETMKIRNRLARAHEELQRCSIETRRLHTAIRDDDVLFDRVLNALHAKSNILAAAVSDFATRRRRVNNHLLTRVYQVYSLSGYIGIKGPGTRVGEEPLPSPPPDAMCTEPTISRDTVDPIDIGDDGEDEDVQGDLGGVVDYFGDLALR